MSDTGNEPEDGTEVGNSGEIGVQSSDLKSRLKSNLSWFAGFLLPAEIRFGFPKFYQMLWLLFTEVLFRERDFSKYALALPRGHGKTMFIKFLIIFIILFTKRRFVAVICAKQDLAENIIRDVIGMLDSKNVRLLFGNWDDDVTTNSVEKKIFRFRGRQIILKPEGAGTSFRGVNIENARPDVMIFDDSQTKDCANSEAQALNYIQWFQGTALKAKDPIKCTFLYVGNMYANKILREDPITGKIIYGCHLRNLKDDPNWKTIIVGGILADGSALWEELQPKEQLLAEFESDSSMGMPEIFFAEVMNDPDAQINTEFDFEKVPINPYEGIPPDGKFLMIDPSLGKEKSDDQIVGEFWVYGNTSVLQKLDRYQCSAPTLVYSLIDRCLKSEIPLVLAESYAYQATLVQWFDTIAKQKGILGLHCKGISRGMKSKNSAILDWLKTLIPNTTINKSNTRAECYLAKDVRSEVFDQIRTFDKHKTDNRDDKLDVGYYGYIAAGNSELMEFAHQIFGEISNESAGELIIPSGTYR